MKYINKTKKGTILLLSIFLILFIVSIIGIIYSYNKRIFQLAKQERDNYKVFKKQFDEVFTNLYIVDLVEKGWNTTFFDLGISINPQTIPINHQINHTIRTNDRNNPPTPQPNIIFSSQGDNLIININNSSEVINTEIGSLKSERKAFFDKFTSEDAKNTIKEIIKRLLGNNINIEIENVETTPAGYNENTQSIEVSYKVRATIYPKIKQNKSELNVEKKYIITLKYIAEAPIEAQASVTGEYSNSRYVGQNIYEHTYTYNVSGSLSLTSSVRLIDGSIKKSKN